jgi:hypothetical protein
MVGLCMLALVGAGCDGGGGEKCQANSCSGHGACDDSTGAIVCTCEAGYAGAICDSCAAGYHDEAGACVPDGVSCQANSCSGHGACDDSTGAIVCTCEAGYAGATCDSCAAGYHEEAGACVPDGVSCQADSCSGHGTCDDSTGAIVCTCEAGYAGESCDACAAGYHRDGQVCVLDTECGPNSCSGHGACDDSSGVVVCTCEAGYAQPFCASCAEGYQDHDQDGACLPDCATAGLDCSGHGQCADDSGLAVCVCDLGHAGETCADCAAGYQDHDQDGACLPDCSLVDCVPHATCEDASGTAVCVCLDAYTGEDCEACSQGYQDHDQDGTCLPDCSLLDMNCGPHAACDDSGGQGVCVCDAGYTGEGCMACAEGYQDHDQDGTCLPTCATAGLTCPAHASCQDATGTALCVCDDGYTGPACEDCAQGYQDHDQDGTCLPTCATAGLVCPAHASCQDATGTALCVCDLGYAGPECATCAAGYQDHDLDGTCLPTCETLGWLCGGHGVCDDSSGAAACQCDPGYQPGAPGQCVPAGTGESCASPRWLDLAQASVSGTTSGMGNHHNPPTTCTYSSSAPEVVYVFQVVQPLVITFETSGFDTVMYLRSNCQAGPDLDCDDDDGPGTGSRITYDFQQPGTYYLFVDGYSSNAGAYTLTVDVACGQGWVYDPVSGACVDDPCLPNPCSAPHQTTCVVALPGYVCECNPGYVPDGAGGCMPDPNPQGEACADAIPLPVVATGSVTGSTLGARDDAQATCGGSAAGPDRVYALDLPVEMRFEVQTDGAYDSVLHLRSVCDSQASQLACDDDSGPNTGSLLLQILPAGSYYLWVDTYGTGTGGAYTLSYSLRANPCADDELVCPGTPVCVPATDFSAYECVCPAGTIPWGGECLDDPCEPNECTLVAHRNRCVVDDATTGAYHCECNIGYIPDPGDPTACVMDPDANDWAFIVFLNADNNLEDYGHEDVAEMGVAGSTPYVHIVALFDTYAGPARIIYVTQGGYQVVSEEGELDMSDWRVLRDFGIWAVENYPARHYAFIMWNHGGGWQKDLAPRNPVLKGFSNDDHGSAGEISVANGDYARALAGITQALGGRIDVVGFDACLMGMWEVAHESAPYADYLLASEETEPGPGWPYDGFMPGLIQNHTMSPLELASSIVNAYHQASSSNDTLSVVDLSTLGALNPALSSLANAMMAHPEHRAAIRTIAGQTQSFYYSSNKDLWDFAARLQASASLHQDIRTAASALIAQLQQSIAYNRVQTSYANAHGMAIYLPTSGLDSSYRSASWSVATTWDDFLVWLGQ